MPTEEDLRIAFRDMERFTPDAAEVLRAVYDQPRRPARSRRLSPHRPIRPVLRAGLALGAAGAVAVAAVIAAVAHGPATKATPITAPALRTRLLAAIDTASGDILYAHGGPAPGGGTWQSPAYPQPGQEVHFRILGLGSDGKVYKDGEYSFRMPSGNAAAQQLHLQPRPGRAAAFRDGHGGQSLPARLGCVARAVHPRVHPRRGRCPRRDRQRPVHGRRADRTAWTAGHRAGHQRATQQRSPAPCDGGAAVGGRHDLPADAAVPAHVQWAAERHGLHLPPANPRESGETAPGNPGGLHPRQRQLGGLVRPPETEDGVRSSHCDDRRRDRALPGAQTPLPLDPARWGVLSWSGRRACLYIDAGWQHVQIVRTCRARSLR